MTCWIGTASRSASELRIRPFMPHQTALSPDPEAWDTIKLVEQRFSKVNRKHQAWLDAGQPLNKGGRCNAGHWRRDSWADGVRLFTRKLDGQRLSVTQWEELITARPRQHRNTTAPTTINFLGDNTMIRIPKRFYDDHAERDLESPAILKETARHYWIAADQHLAELLSDADFYSIENTSRLPGPGQPGHCHARAITRYLDDHREQRSKTSPGDLNVLTAI